MATPDPAYPGGPAEPADRSGLPELDELQQRMSDGTGDEAMQRKHRQDHWLAGTVSPAFRKTVWAPYLKLVARPQGDKPCVFSTTFLASARS